MFIKITRFAIKFIFMDEYKTFFFVSLHEEFHTA